MTSTSSTSELEATTRFTASLQIIGSMTVGGMFQGFMTTTAALCVYSLIQTRRRRSRRHLAFLLVYIGALWTAGTLIIGILSGTCIYMFVFHASTSLDSPYEQAPAPEVFTVGGTIAYWTILMLSDGMMVWRFKVIWSNSRYYRYLMITPVVFYLGIIILGFFAYVLFSDLPVWGGDNISGQLNTAVILSSFCLNVYVTALVVGRLFIYRRRFKANWGSPDAMHYTSMGSMLVESYLPLTICTVLFVVPYLLDNPAQYMMSAILSEMQITASLMVMYRISRGIAWDSSTTPHSIESAIDRALEAHERQVVQTEV